MSRQRLQPVTHVIDDRTRTALATAMGGLAGTWVEEKIRRGIGGAAGALVGTVVGIAAASLVKNLVEDVIGREPAIAEAQSS
jgi:hypothetical protein